MNMIKILALLGAVSIAALASASSPEELFAGVTATAGAGGAAGGPLDVIDLNLPSEITTPKRLCDPYAAKTSPSYGKLDPGKVNTKDFLNFFKLDHVLLDRATPLENAVISPMGAFYYMVMAHALGDRETQVSINSFFESHDGGASELHTAAHFLRYFSKKEKSSWSSDESKILSHGYLLDGPSLATTDHPTLPELDITKIDHKETDRATCEFLNSLITTNTEGLIRGDYIPVDLAPDRINFFHTLFVNAVWSGSAYKKTVPFTMPATASATTVPGFVLNSSFKIVGDYAILTLDTSNGINLVIKHCADKITPVAPSDLVYSRDSCDAYIPVFSQRVKLDLSDAVSGAISINPRLKGSQEAIIKVDDVGIKAAALTKLCLEGCGPGGSYVVPEKYEVNSPFSFVVTLSGRLPLFSGVVFTPIAEA
jgi:hypothetical protein